MDGSTSVFARSRAARGRPPKICGPAGSFAPASGENIRHAATPTPAAPKMTKLRRMMLAGVWPSERNTTIVAPTSPASVKNCQGCKDCGSVEVAEFIVQAGADGWIEPRLTGGDYLRT